MVHNHSHSELLDSLKADYSELLQNSEQAIYIYFDDENKICNKKFAKLLGYESDSEWEKINGSFTESFVDESSHETLVNAYRNAMEKGNGSKIEVHWKDKAGKKVNTQVILVPIVHGGHLFALHFVSA